MANPVFPTHVSKTDDPRPDVDAEPLQAPLGPWQADLGDGHYKNPVLHADYSDPDAIRVGQDYWMTASSFNHVPGLPLLHSRDLVNWSLVGHALSRQVPVAHFATPRHGEGVWAPALRHHAGKFWIFYPDPDFGIYVITAADPRGEWSVPFLLKAGRGLIDPCPLWDDDGRAWMVHGWAKSRAGFCNRITLHEISPDCLRVLDEGRVIINGDEMSGWKTIEGPKLYKRQGHYYVFAPAGGVTEGYQAVFRAKNIQGPYENRIVLEQGDTPVNGPHQGAWVDTPSGQNWFLHFQELPAHGRVVHLQPMKWRADGWPVMGADPAGSGTGQPVLRHQKPDTGEQPLAVPPTSDAFPEGKPGPQWQWQGNPDSSWVLPRLGARAGLRLRPVPGGGSLWASAHPLMQKFPAPSFEAETKLRLVDCTEAGTRAGLLVFGYNYAWIGLKLDAFGCSKLMYAVCKSADKGGSEVIKAMIDWPENQPVVLRVEVDADLHCRFLYKETGGRRFHTLGDDFKANSSKWVGAKIGLFCSAGSPQDRPPAKSCAQFEDFVLR